MTACSHRAAPHCMDSCCRPVPCGCSSSPPCQQRSPARMARQPRHMLRLRRCWQPSWLQYHERSKGKQAELNAGLPHGHSRRTHAGSRGADRPGAAGGRCHTVAGRNPGSPAPMSHAPAGFVEVPERGLCPSALAERQPTCTSIYARRRLRLRRTAPLTSCCR